MLLGIKYGYLAEGTKNARKKRLKEANKTPAGRRREKRNFGKFFRVTCRQMVSPYNDAEAYGDSLGRR
jgi:hypothetical protein